VHRLPGAQHEELARGVVLAVVAQVQAQVVRAARAQGLTLPHFKAQLEDLRDTSLTLELNLSTFGPHPRVHLGCLGNKVSLS